MKTKTIPLLLAGWIVASALAAQEEPRPSFEGRVEVTEVLLNVVVTDRQGNAVAGLGREDFAVQEDGRPVELTDVRFYSTRYASPAASREERSTVPGETVEVPASRYFILFFHDQRRVSTPEYNLVRQQLDAARYARRWVEDELGPSDWVAVVSYDVKLKVQQDFTQNRRDLVQAIEAAARGREGEEQRPWRIDEVPATQPSLLRHLAHGKQLRDDTTKEYDALRLLAEASGHVVGRKNLLLFSIGFGELRSGVAPVALPDERYYPAMEEALNDNNVAVYPIDLSPTGAVTAQSNFLSTLAADTGGLYYRSFSSFATPLRQIARQNVGYYELAYRSEHPGGESGYQEVEVSVIPKKLRVRAQKGYRFGS